MNRLLEPEGQFSLGSDAVIFPLHSLMPTARQRDIFDRPKKGLRKVIIATNIAETSITIEDVVFVVDCGKIKIKNFNVESNMTTLQPEWASLANMKQRLGRAGTDLFDIIRCEIILIILKKIFYLNFNWQIIQSCIILPLNRGLVD